MIAFANGSLVLIFTWKVRCDITSVPVADMHAINTGLCSVLIGKSTRAGILAASSRIAGGQQNCAPLYLSKLQRWRNAK